MIVRRVEREALEVLEALQKGGKVSPGKCKTITGLVWVERGGMRGMVWIALLKRIWIGLSTIKIGQWIIQWTFYSPMDCIIVLDWRGEEKKESGRGCEECEGWVMVVVMDEREHPRMLGSGRRPCRLAEWWQLAHTFWGLRLCDYAALCLCLSTLLLSSCNTRFEHSGLPGGMQPASAPKKPPLYPKETP